MTDVTDVPYEDILDEFLVEDPELAAGCLAQALDDDESPGVIAIAIGDLERAGYTIVLSGPAKPAPTVSGAVLPALARDAATADSLLARAIEDGTAEELAAAIHDLAAAGYAFSLSGPDPAVKRAILKRAKALEKPAKTKAKRPAPAAKRGVASAKAKRKAAQTPARPRRPAAPAAKRAASAAAAL